LQEELIEIRSKMYIDLHERYRLFWSDFSETWIFWIYIGKIMKN